MKRVLALSVALILLVVMLTACTDTASPDDNKPGNVGDGQYDEYGYAKETPVDLNGFTFTIGAAVLYDEMSANPTLNEQLFHQRIEEVERDYNCNIEVKFLYGDISTMMPLILTNEKFADIIHMDAKMLIPNATAGYLTPWEEVEGIDLNDARWIDSFTELTYLNGKHWGVQYMRPPEAAAVLVYNQDLLKANGITEDPAELCLEGKWTFDKFREMAAACTKDTNSDGTMDTYGLLDMYVDKTVHSLITANGGKLITENADGTVSETFSDQKVVNALNFYYDMVNVDGSVMILDHMKSLDTWNNRLSDGDMCNMFRRGKAAFFACDTWTINQYLKGKMKANYRIVPYPTGPDEAAGTYKCLSNSTMTFAIPSTNKDLYELSVIMNALAYPCEGYEGEEWWEEEIQKEYFQDNDTTSMTIYKKLLDNTCLDLGVGAFSFLEGFGRVCILEPIFFGNGSVASSIQSIEGVYTTGINATYEWQD